MISSETSAAFRDRAPSARFGSKDGFMHGTLPAVPRPRSGGSLPLVLRLALRELRGGLRGFGIFLACIALGVAAIAGVSSISRSLTDALTREGHKILGGDMTFSLIHREIDPAQRAFLARS